MSIHTCWTETDHPFLNVKTYQQREEVNGQRVRREIAVTLSAGSDLAMVLEGDRDTVTAILERALALVRETPVADATPPPLGRCECGEAIVWDPTGSRYLGATNASAWCGWAGRTSATNASHSLDDDATDEIRAEHENAYHAKDPMPGGCPWCVVDIVEAGDPTRNYAVGSWDPTEPPEHLATVIERGTGCTATSGVYRCSWIDPNHLSREVPHVAGTGAGTVAVWVEDPGVYSKAPTSGSAGTGTDPARVAPAV